MLLPQNPSSGASLQRYPHYCNIPYKGRVISLKTRSGPEIIGLILQAVEEKEQLTRSKIMYQAMLNFTQVNDYTSLMIQQELLNYSKLDRKYAITDKGRQFLALFTETSKLLTVTTTTTLEDDGNNITGDNTLLLQVHKQQQLPPPQHREVTV